MRTHDRLRALQREFEEVQTEIRILDEQIEFQSSVSDDARIRAMVSETPLADREAREASGDLLRLERSRTEVAAKLDALRREQDRLLEQLLRDEGPSANG